METFLIGSILGAVIAFLAWFFFKDNKKEEIQNEIKKENTSTWGIILGIAPMVGILSPIIVGFLFRLLEMPIPKFLQYILIVVFLSSILWLIIMSVLPKNVMMKIANRVNGKK